MVDWQARVTRGLAAAENRFDQMRLEMKALLGTSRRPYIQTYIGHANRDAFFLRGRVLLGTKVKPATATDSLWRNLRNTYHRFESDEIRFARVRASVEGISKEVTCDEEGFFRVELRPPGQVEADMYWQAVHLELIETPISRLNDYKTTAEGRVIVPPENAQFAVISDLDDTILQTEVLNFFKMMYNTMLKNAYTRLPFAGVAAFYRALHIGTQNTQNPIFYVSSSPWNLYDVILDFYRIRGIPLGPIYLRDLGLSGTNVGGKSHMGHKMAFIQSLLDRHPSLGFILIGDSGQKDAKIYSEAVRRNPGRIKAIYIRDVSKAESDTQIQQIADEVREMGVDMLLVKDTVVAAEHAAANGFITQEALAAVRQEISETENT